ncbi:hypothetical protein BU24DRAFT_460366 [Aaosphaeria arxii CBS 175.79]|uniref:Uncharacterized protein n=1 Tax=Aaosphaeria arxii CBS 175.79 TaxID=1450172 RepID=A0A6A5XWL0_9PLEO|nr:uncharacterized protein BU24DRAFT_460366 [Aaosphaeria arxii CBS 175.79]KAF2017303.1 hypothetical protein BU24DRAFT_460366 [Aaosphaeria arxii CBS 175.79]
MVYGKPWKESEKPGANTKNDCDPVAIATCLSKIAAMPVLAGVLSPLILGAIGFGAAGPIAGSIAATMQSGMGPIAAGSLFSSLQSAAMGTTTFWGGFGGNIATGALHGFCMPDVVKCINVNQGKL